MAVRLTQVALETVDRIAMTGCVVPINIHSSPGDAPFSDNQLGGPYPYSGNLYVLCAQSLVGFSQPQFWVSNDAGITWRLLPLPFGLSTQHRWQFFWYPAVSSSKIIFLFGTVISGPGTAASGLMDFDLSTNSWDTLYAGSGGPSYNAAQIARLSDGRIIAFYHDYSTNNFCWAVANTSGSGVWDSTGHVILTSAAMGTPTIWTVISVTVDTSNTAHCLFGYGVAAANTVAYVNLSSGGTLSTPVTLQTGLPNSGDNYFGNLITAPDGKLYAAAVNTQPGSSFSTVEVWIGSSWAAPAWSRTVLGSYNQALTDYYSVDHAFAAVTGGGQVMVAWTGTHAATPSALRADVEFKQQVSPGQWVGPYNYINFDVTYPTTPLIAGPSGGPHWHAVGLSLYPLAASPQGMGLVVKMGTVTLTSLTVNAAHFVRCLNATNNYIAMGNSLASSTLRYIV
jgi:hypothetical protein